MPKLLEYFTDTQKELARKLQRVIEALSIVGVLFAAGGVTGYWVRDNLAAERRAMLVADHQAELARTTKAFESSLSFLVTRIGGVATQVESAAASTEAAADSAEKAATLAQKAAKQSSAASSKANLVPETTREQINRSVQRANSGLK